MKWRSMDFSEWPEMPSTDLLAQWSKVRDKKGKPLVQAVVDDMGNRLQPCVAAGYSVDQVLRAICVGGWLSVHVDWLRNQGLKPEREPAGGQQASPSELADMFQQLQDADGERQALLRLNRAVPQQLVDKIESLRQQYHAAKSAQQR